jgi:hypothetical protein
MKKYFLIGLIIAIAPNFCFGAGARYTQLVREKQRKMEELEKCMGATKGLKIAGLSTIGLTAVGVAGNIAEAKKRDDLAASIESADKQLPEINEQIATEQTKFDERKNREDEQARIINITNDNIQKSLTELVDSDEFKANVAAADAADSDIANMEIELIEEEESELPDELIQHTTEKKSIPLPFGK